MPSVKSLLLLAATIVTSHACRPDTRPYVISNLHTKQLSTTVTVIDFDVSREGSEPFHCTRTEDDEVAYFDVYWSPCENTAFRITTLGWQSTPPPSFAIELQHQLVCPPTPEVQKWNWTTGNLRDAFIPCTGKPGAKECQQNGKGPIIYAEWN